MTRIACYLVVAALAAFNGVFSPKAFVVFALQGVWYPFFLPAPLTLMFVLSGMITAFLHGLATGIPVAILERIRPEFRRSTTSALLWIALLLVPTAMTILPWFADRGN